MSKDPRLGAILWPKRPLHEDFHVGQTFEYHWGRTIFAAGTILFATLTVSFNPLYFSHAYAKAHGRPDIVVNPHLSLNVVSNPSVEDSREIGGPLPRVFDLTYDQPAHPSATITARSETSEARLSDGNSSNGIVTWRTEGFNDAGARVESFRQSNLIRRRSAKGAG
jgi:itaconyl-CoA hydratase